MLPYGFQRLTRAAFGPVSIRLALRFARLAFKASPYEVAHTQRSIAYMVNEQVPCQLPFKLMDTSALA